MTDDDLAYFTRRRAEEQARAEESSTPAAANIHRELAAHYDRVVAPSAPRGPELSAAQREPSG